MGKRRSKQAYACCLLLVKKETEKKMRESAARDREDKERLERGRELKLPPMAAQLQEPASSNQAATPAILFGLAAAPTRTGGGVPRRDQENAATTMLCAA